MKGRKLEFLWNKISSAGCNWSNSNARVPIGHSCCFCSFSCYCIPRNGKLPPRNGQMAIVFGVLTRNQHYGAEKRVRCQNCYRGCQNNLGLVLGIPRLHFMQPRCILLANIKFSASNTEFCIKILVNLNLSPFSVACDCEGCLLTALSLSANYLTIFMPFSKLTYVSVTFAQLCIYVSDWENKEVQHRFSIWTMMNEKAKKDHFGPQRVKFALTFLSKQIEHPIRQMLLHADAEKGFECGRGRHINRVSNFNWNLCYLQKICTISDTIRDSSHI